MKYSIWYCDRDVDLELPDDWHIDLFDLPGKRLKPVATDHWVYSGKIPADLQDFLTSSQKLLVVVNDHYRPTPTAQILKAVIPHLKLDSTTVLVATGLHGDPGEKGLALIFGEQLPKIRHRIRIHSAFDESEFVNLGSGEYQVKLNRLFEESDSILLIGSVEPHYFAGFTGGRKIILPGCASFADVSRNHANALSPQSQPLARRGNPVWEDIRLRTSCLNYKRRYAIQLVSDHHQSVFYCAAGDWDRAYDEACSFVRDHYSFEIERPYDVVISVVYPPLDRNLYQLQKSYENVAAAVRPGGIVMLISGCLEGTGDGRFIKLARDSAMGMLATDEESEWMLMGIHKVKRTENLARHVSLKLVSTLRADELEFLPIAPLATLEEAVETIKTTFGTHHNIAVVLDSASQVLCLRPTGAEEPTQSRKEENHA